MSRCYYNALFCWCDIDDTAPTKEPIDRYRTANATDRQMQNEKANGLLGMEGRSQRQRQREGSGHVRLACVLGVGAEMFRNWRLYFRTGIMVSKIANRDCASCCAALTFSHGVDHVLKR